MSTVDDVAEELGTSVEDVLEACAHLDIVASTGASGLSFDEHTRLRDALGGGADLPEIVRGSQQSDPMPTRDTRSFLERHDDLLPEADKPRWDMRTATRVAIGLFLLVGVGVAVVSLSGRVDEPVSILGYGLDDEGTCHVLDESGGPLLTEVACDEPHDVQLIAVLAADVDEPVESSDDDATDMPAPFPGTVALFDDAGPRCAARFEATVGRPDDESDLDVALLVPTPETWEAGDRAILCLVEDPAGPLTESVEGADR